MMIIFVALNVIVFLSSAIGADGDANQATVKSNAVATDSSLIPSPLLRKLLPLLLSKPTFPYPVNDDTVYVLPPQFPLVSPFFPPYYPLIQPNSINREYSIESAESFTKVLWNFFFNLADSDGTNPSQGVKDSEQDFVYGVKPTQRQGPLGFLRGPPGPEGPPGPQGIVALDLFFVLLQLPINVQAFPESMVQQVLSDRLDLRDQWVLRVLSDQPVLKGQQVSQELMENKGLPDQSDHQGHLDLPDLLEHQVTHLDISCPLTKDDEAIQSY